MVTTTVKKKSPKRFNFDPVSISSKAHCITNNIIEHINDQRKEFDAKYGWKANNKKKLSIQLNQLISNHDFPKSSIERLIRLKYINKQLDLKLQSRQLVDEYICKIENIILKNKIDYHKEIAKKCAKLEEFKLKEIDYLDEMIDAHILDSIAKSRENSTLNVVSDVECSRNVEFENYLEKLITNFVENKPTENEIAATCS